MRARTALLAVASAFALGLSGPVSVSAATHMDVDGAFHYYYNDAGSGVRMLGTLNEPPQAECVSLFDGQWELYGYAPHNSTNAVAEIWADSTECQGLPSRVLLPNGEQQPDSVQVKSVKFRLPLP
ncbi:hypothetical protein [Streptomyces antimicrobicus]|uniref:Secreted protein n=1 Tax=Streptomyces antimicrobicus TaxID=2883108 RepID=A0ABS8B007_9ACTN|nr:hypothetical protein [Streptomyces antimicrobicus]MCB5177943.1 hypothetical protein [Streptomyces antimicrobicus]